MTSSLLTSKSEAFWSCEDLQDEAEQNLSAVPPKASAPPVLQTRGFITCKFNSSPDRVYISTSTADFAPTVSTTETHPAVAVIVTHNRPKPILIPAPTLQVRDINRVPTPLSGRGDRKGHLFPFSKSPSPRACSARSLGKSRTSSFSDGEEIFGRLERVRSASPSSSTSVGGRAQYENFNMHSESIGVGRYPTSPLSPKPPSRSGNLSPQNSQRRGNHGRQASRNMQLNMGRFHPSNFLQADTSLAGSSSMQAPQITYTRAPPPTQIESPRLLREKHREFIEKARLSSKLAASPLSIKPDAPRLDPLGSPKGPVTPLALEEANDYFAIPSAGRISPNASPGSRSPRANSVSSDEGSKPNKSRKINGS